MVMAMIFEVCLCTLLCVWGAFVGYDRPSFFEILFFSSIIEIIKYSVVQFFHRVVSGNTTTLVTTVDAAVVLNVHSQTEQKTFNELELEAKFLPLQGTTSLTPHERADREAIIPVVRSFFVWKICQALDLPATFDPLKTGANSSLKQLETDKPIPIVHSIAVFEMCKALKLNATLDPQ
ncbi:hypothetical protein NPIL_577781 [Nephila pilipes]|uniref:Uncharacterized protein n=1 Tax=Nephila pilipes TaxID=299642 RepID=A0A8X6R5Q2_NEPPI|nr:hypothetical protein NPIL_378391 [Nephila pilipes]GFT09154.1 hypothetical protein NPIL_345931 [Nephila pilipes]GFT90339.1 hypothetical protein NPIL_269201 [Nephila pilipes]GFU52421.1 hypothetical protein NPIL_577781 [Nephila pilipes]